MPSHSCLDPHDPYAQAEVLVEFDGGPADVRLIAAIDAAKTDILDDLDDGQREDLVREITADFVGYRLGLAIPSPSLPAHGTNQDASPGRCRG